MRILIALFALLGVMVSAGCQPIPINAGERLEPEASPAVTQMTETPTRAIITPGRIELPMNNTPERVPPTESSTPATGEVPSGLLEAIFKDVVGRTGATSEEISMIQAQAVVWGDGSLGCPQPGMEYTQVLVPGYWVVLDVNGKQYDYRATTKGYFFLCEGGGSPITPGGSPDS